MCKTRKNTEQPRCVMNSVRTVVCCPGFARCCREGPQFPAWSCQAMMHICCRDLLHHDAHFLPSAPAISRLDLPITCCATVEKDRHLLPRHPAQLLSRHARPLAPEPTIPAEPCAAAPLPRFFTLDPVHGRCSATFEALQLRRLRENSRIYFFENSSDRARFSGLL